MKITKTLSVALLIAMISTMGLTGVSAYGQWSGQGQNLTAEEKAEMQNMTQEEKEAYMEEKGIEMQDDDGDGIPNKDDEDYVKTQDGTNKSENAGQGKSENAGSGSGSMNGGSDMSKWNGNSVLKAQYKNTYEEKYGDAISKMTDDQLNTFITKVDDIADKVNTGDYSDATKDKYNAMLDALREIAEDNLDSTDDLLDGLFE